MKQTLYSRLSDKYKLTPPDLHLVIIGLQVLFHYIFPIKDLIDFPISYLGIFLIIFGEYLNIIWVANVFLRKEKTTTSTYEIPKKLVTYGWFKYSRNPTYLGMTISLLGVAILTGSLITFIFPVLFIILTDKLVIPIEEKNMKKKFGKKYLDYKKKVRRWI